MAFKLCFLYFQSLVRYDQISVSVAKVSTI